MTLRERERASIERFLLENVVRFKDANVLDLGCGQQPYRHLVELMGGTYTGWDSPHQPGSVVTEHVGNDLDLGRSYDVVMMTQVWQYVPLSSLWNLLSYIATPTSFLKPGGWLLVTGPTNWPVIEKEDLHRFTPTGVASLLGDAGFPLVEVHERHYIEHGGERWSCGWAAAARSAQ